MPEMDVSSLFNGLAGIAALFVALTMRPAIRDLRKIVEHLEDRQDNQGERLAALEARK